MPANRTNILDQFNNDSILGKGFGGDDKRNPKEISLTNNGPYNVSQLSYPEDVSIAADLQHYVVFYINIRGKTKFKNQSVVDVDVSTTGQNRTSAGARVGAAAASVGITGAAAGIALGKEIAEKSKIGRNLTKGIFDFLRRKGASRSQSTLNTAQNLAVGTVAGGVGLAGAAAVGGLAAFSENLKIDEPARLSDAILLPVDSIPQVRYQMTYDEYDAGILAGLFGGSSAIDSDMGTVVEGVERGLLALADLGKQVAGLGNAKQNILSAAAAQTNPFKEVFFKAINFRSFSFNYTFLPKSESEVYNVKRIIDLFKFHMHPELSGDLFYLYPSEFEIAYYHQGAENPFINKISTCVLTDMNVQYGSQFFTAFDNGAPSEIKLTLSFKEVELLTKERIVKGY